MAQPRKSRKAPKAFVFFVFFVAKKSLCSSRAAAESKAPATRAAAQKWTHRPPGH